MKNRNLESITAPCSTALTTLCIDLQRCDCVISRWINLTCRFHQKNWHDGRKHQQLGTWSGENESPDNLIGHGRLIQDFVRQIVKPSHVVVFTDSDNAGCLRTRRSTSQSKLLHGSHMLRSTGTTQAVTSLSSEFHGSSLDAERPGEEGLTSAKTPKLIKQCFEVRDEELG